MTERSAKDIARHDLYLLERVELGDARRHFQFDEPCLVVGTLPNTTALRMSQVRRFWIEEE